MNPLKRGFRRGFRLIKIVSLLSILIFDAAATNIKTKTHHFLKNKNHKAKTFAHSDDISPQSTNTTIKTIDARTVPAQPQLVGIPTERSVYVSPNKTVYWPVEKPFWIRLSTSSDDTSPSYLLNKLHESNLDSNSDIDGKGIHLEMSGHQFIRWINAVSKKEIMYQFAADGNPPQVEYHLLQALKHEDKNNIYLGKDLDVTFTATDDQSGVKQIYYSVDGRGFEYYQKALPLHEEKPYFIYYYATDNVGYASHVALLKFYVDLTPPQSSHKVEQNYRDNILGPGSDIELFSHDQISGEKQIFYKFDQDQEYKLYTTKISVNLKDGSHVMNYYGIDNVGNQEIPKSYAFYFAKSAPQIVHFFLGDSYKRKLADQEVIYISMRTMIKLDAETMQTKIQNIRYQIDQGSWQSYKEPFSLAVSNHSKVSGKDLDTSPHEFNLHYDAEDELHIKSEPKTVKIILDQHPPESTFSISEPHYSQTKDSYFITSQSKIRLASVDKESGVKQIQYEFDNEIAANYTSELSLPKEGKYFLRYWAEDFVHNQEEAKAIFLIVDNTPPEILYDFNQNPLMKATNPSEASVYPVGTTVILNAMDAVSGVKEILFGMGKDELKPYKGIISLEKPGKYEINVTAVDHLGNRATKNINLRIEEPSLWKNKVP